MTKRAMMESAYVLKLARNIFGEDIIRNAWVVAFGTRQEEHQEVQARLIEARTRFIRSNETKTSLVSEGHGIVLEFPNDRLIHFESLDMFHIGPVENVSLIIKEYL